MLNINTEKNGNELTFKLSGRLDTASSPELQEVLNNSLDGAASLVLDLKELEYISSSGLRVLLSAHKSMSGKEGMIVKNVNETVMEVFEITGFSDILSIE